MFEIKKIYDIRSKYNDKYLLYFIKCSYGINNFMLYTILNKCKINKLNKLKILQLSDLELKNIVSNIIKLINLYNNKLNFMNNINNMRKIKTYKYIRHVLNLPVNGQRTHTNRKTQRKFSKFITTHIKKHIFKI